MHTHTHIQLIHTHTSGGKKGWERVGEAGRRENRGRELEWQEDRKTETESWGGRKTGRQRERARVAGRQEDRGRELEWQEDRKTEAETWGGRKTGRQRQRAGEVVRQENRGRELGRQEDGKTECSVLSLSP